VVYLLWRDERGNLRVIHEGLVYTSDEEYVDVVVPVLREAVEAGQPALAALPVERQELVKRHLGEAAASVEFHDTISWYSRPGAALVAWSRALDRATAEADLFVHAIGEPPLAHDVGREERWERYEAFFNQLHREDPVRIICPYDARTLSQTGIDVCLHTHPTMATTTGDSPSPEFFATRSTTPYAPLSEFAGEETSRATAASAAELVELRRAVVWPALALRIPVPDVQDLVLGVVELAEAIFATSTAPVTVVTRRTADGWTCELSSPGLSPRDLATGRAHIAIGIGSIVADRLELGSGLVRFVFHESMRGARERILAAAEQLFGRQGIRRTTVDAIASEAKVAKATFYTHFASKDELARTWVEVGAGNWDRLARSEVEARASSAPEQLLAWFDVLVEWAALDVTAETSLIRVWVESRDPSNAAFQQYQQSTDEVRSYLSELAAAGAAGAEQLARELQLLAQGAVLEAGRVRSAEPLNVARGAAAKLVAATFPPAS
jgi:AcrR family transcriptional regulator